MSISSAVSAHSLINQGLPLAIGREQSVAQPEQRMGPSQHEAGPVNRNGTRPGKLERFAAEASKNLWFFPGMSNVLSGIAKARSNGESAVSGALAGFNKTCTDGFGQALVGAATGDYKAVAKGYFDAVRKNDATPASVKTGLHEVSDAVNLVTALRAKQP
ncbi:hypothetical protein [Pseudomonas orientalis]|uniref:hypothetical protein n=1 Tax=Pseudomonas orientalis TaxID=76758 RepID=UPI000F57D024|nr:hypothetical protein [Pseudomonas orientalis]AZE87833.1 hypothetical protein C4J97_1116 [Pseudomonas orientalis]